MTVLHAGSKFDRNTYKVSGGLHGVGIHVVNALSEWFEIKVHRDGLTHFQRYERGAPVAPIKTIGKSEGTGTEIRFRPDATVFETVVFDKAVVERRLKELSFLNPQVAIHFRDERDGTATTFHHAGGITEFVLDLERGQGDAVPATDLAAREARADRHRGRPPVTTTGTMTRPSPSSTTSTRSTAARTSSACGPR